MCLRQSGRRTRTVTTLPDDTLVCVDYNSKVTATVNSCLRVHRPDGAVILCEDDGTVQFRPRGARVSPAVVGAGVGDPFGDDGDGSVSPAHSGSLTAPEEDDNVNCFLFQLFTGDMTVCLPDPFLTFSTLQASHAPRHTHALPSTHAPALPHPTRWRAHVRGVVVQMVDELRNSFSVSKGVSAVVKMAGAMDAKGVLPRVTSPLPPRIFFMNGDGTAAELLSPERWAGLYGASLTSADTTALAVTAPPSAAVGYGRSNAVLPALGRSVVAVPVPVPDPYADAKLSPTTEAEAKAHVFTMRLGGGGFPTDSAAVGVGVLNRRGRVQVWSSCRGWIRSSGGARAAAVTAALNALGTFSTFRSGASQTLPPPVPTAQPAAATHAGPWLVATLPEALTASVASAVGTGCTRSAVAWRRVVEVKQAGKDLRALLQSEEAAYEQFLKVRSIGCCRVALCWS